MPISFKSVVPVLRIFDTTKADEFYTDFLGFSVDWQHRFEDKLPLYQQVSRGDLVLHLTEHHGDCCPGAQIRVNVEDVKQLHQELQAKEYSYMRPGLEKTAWGTQEMLVIDPFGNQIRFCEAMSDGPKTEPNDSKSE